MLLSRQWSSSLRREGRLSVLVKGPNHCGHPSAVDQDGRVVVKYTVDLTVDNPSFDARGFLVDQEEIHQILVDETKTTPWILSCEKLAMVWANTLITSIEANSRVVVTRLSLTLSPAPHLGALTATYIRGE